MEITTRAALDTDRADCILIEAAAIRGIRYIDDVWQLFTRRTEGELTISLADGRTRGMGKLTRLYGGFGWLESLRVHPDVQGMGLGKAIYRRYLEQMESLALTAIGMYTGADNVVSRGLAEKHGLSLAGRFSEYLAAPATGERGGFEPVPAAQGEAVLSPYYEAMGDFAVVNRTWFPVRPGLGEHVASQGWLFGDDAGNLVVAGARFQRKKAIHVPFFHGDPGKCLAFAFWLCSQGDSGGLSAIRDWRDAAQAGALTGHGFVREPQDHDLITLWRGL